MSTWHVTVWPCFLPGLGRDTVMRPSAYLWKTKLQNFLWTQPGNKKARRNGIGQAQVVNRQWEANVQRSETLGRTKKQKVLICVLRARGGRNRRISCLGNDLTHSLLHACNILCFYALWIGPTEKCEITDKVTLCHHRGTRNVIPAYEKKDDTGVQTNNVNRESYEIPECISFAPTNGEVRHSDFWRLYIPRLLLLFLCLLLLLLLFVVVVVVVVFIISTRGIYNYIPEQTMSLGYTAL